MNNKIKRKIIILTLLAIILVGGITFAALIMMPEVYVDNVNLFVSAENSEFNNYMSGPQVIEVIVINSDINDINKSNGEPTVTVNGNKLRMVQAVDGNWYGYFADLYQALEADSTTTVPGSGLDYGTFCDAETTNLGMGTSDVYTSETVGIAISRSGGANTNTGFVNGEITIDCDTIPLGDNDIQNVLREEKDINPFPADGAGAGQIGINPNFWPFIQLYNLPVGGNVIITYNSEIGLQSTSLTFDTTEAFANAELDKTKYPTNAHVHATITDLWLNIDPTDEDSWTFGTDVTESTRGPHYQVFNENGLHVGHPINIHTHLSNLLCETNCDLLIDINAQNAVNPVLTLQDNSNTELTLASNGLIDSASSFGVKGFDNDVTTDPLNPVLVPGSVPVTLTEQGPNTGIFGTYDESDVSILKITSDAARDTSATLTYNQDDHTILVGFDFATIDIQPNNDTWNSGEKIPIVIVDGDANNNSRADEDLNLYDPNVSIIPSLQTGNPFTLGSGAVGNDRQIKVVAIKQNLIRNGGDTQSLVSPFVVGSGPNAEDLRTYYNSTTLVDRFSQRAIINFNSSDITMVRSIAIDLNQTLADLQDTINDNRNKPDNTANPFVPFTGFNLFNYDIKSLAPNADSVNVYVLLTDGVVINSTGIVPDGVDSIWIHQDGDAQGYIPISDEANNALFSLTGSDAQAQNIGLLFQFSGDAALDVDLSKRYPIVADFISFGFENDGLVNDERIANQIIRIEAKETGENTSTFTGTLEYTMINQLNINDINTYLGISTIADDPTFIVIKNLRDEVRVIYLDLGEDGIETQISDSEKAPSYDGVVSFDSDSYRTGDVIVITVDDLDLDVNSDLKDIYTVVTIPDDLNRDVVGSATTENGGTSITLRNGEQLGRLLEVTFDDQRWTENNDCGIPANVDAGLGATGFTLTETTKDSGLFVGSFQIPAEWCRTSEDTLETATDFDIKVNYFDFRDANGEINEVEDSVSVKVNTSSVSLDRTVYPVPFGVPGDFGESTSSIPADITDKRSLFPIHQTGMDSPAGLDIGEFLNAGDLSIHLRVYDSDFDVSASGIDTISENVAGTNNGPVKISVIRDSDIVVLGYAGGPNVIDGTIDVGDDGKNHHGTTPVDAVTRSFGPLSEISPNAGIFEVDITVRYTDGPASTLCPDTFAYAPIDGNAGSSKVENRFDAPITTTGENYCILQGDVLQVEYIDSADVSGDTYTVTDLATFDLRDGVLQSDKSVYVVGSDMILTLIEPDLDLDSDQAETYDLDLIEWGYDAVILTMGDASGNAATAAFDPKPINLTETGNGTGVFQLVVKVPKVFDNNSLERGKEIVLEYTDWGPSGSEYVGDEDKDVSLTVFTSNFGATVALDKKVYSWTDKVYITIVAPDYNFDSDIVDEIGDSDRDPVRVATRGFDIDGYKLVETGTDTGIFTGEVILTGFEHDADGDGTIDDTNPRTQGTGPTDGFLQADNDDLLVVSFAFSEDETVVGSSLIRWNVGVVQWLEAHYSPRGTGIVRVIDPDLNLDPEAADHFNIDVWSDSNKGGVDLIVTETGDATGIYEGFVHFTIFLYEFEHRLGVSEGDTVTAKYKDNTLPDPYSTADELDVVTTIVIGSIVPPL